MATLRNKRRLAAVSRERPKNTRNNQSQNTLNQGMAEVYITQVSEESEGRITEKLSQEFSRTESRILGALCKLDEFLLNPQIRTYSVAVPVTSRNNKPENQEPTGDRFLNNPCPEVELSACRTSNLTETDQEETHHTSLFLWLCFNQWLAHSTWWGQTVKHKLPLIRKKVWKYLIFKTSVFL